MRNERIEREQKRDRARKGERGRDVRIFAFMFVVVFKRVLCII